MFKKIIKQIQHSTESNQRSRIGILASKIGLFTNLFLFLIKILAGLIAGSVSILADAMNNLSDSASSIMTLIGFHYAAKPADKEHPYGHERSEYISGLFVSILIILVGYQFFTTSLNKLFNPEPTTFNTLIFIILILSIGVKLLYGQFTQELANEIKSTSIRAVAQDSLNDVYITSLVLISSIIESQTGWMIDGFVGLLIALYIMWTAIQLIKESINDLLGSRPDQELIERIQEILDSYDILIGYHDLLVHHYGPNKTYASIHIEMDDTMTLVTAHKIINEIEDKVEDELGIRLLCHIDPIAIQDQEVSDIYRQIKRMIKEMDPDLKFHDFQFLEGRIQFDIVMPETTVLKPEEIELSIQEEVIERIGNYKVEINFERIYLLNNH